MEIQQAFLPVRLPRLSEDVLGFDLEMANSFRDTFPVICMIGTEYYEPHHTRCVSTIASITARGEEPDLIRWFLSHLAQFKDRHPGARLATFSGNDNDLPWVKDRIARFGIEAEAAGVLEAFQNLDLRVEFRKRTQNDRISLKKLEELFGIERESTLSSRKVSYLLTDILTRNGRGADIPEKLYRYLGEDVHNLLVILDRWEGQSLDTHFLTEYEYLNQVVSLLKATRRLGNAGGARLNQSHLAALDAFAGELSRALDQAIAREGFEQFVLPPPPTLEARHTEVERIKRKYQQLAAIQVTGGKGRSYRLGRQLNRPKGTLAVVRREGRLLMIRRAEDLERAPGYWGLPGGVLEQGESPLRGAVRELREELNLKGTPVQLLGTQPSMTRAYELFWVEVQVDDPAPLRPRAEEVAEVRWVAPQEISSLDPLIPGAIDGFRHFLGPHWAPSTRQRRPQRARSRPGR
jgi:8-oxo-dGTP pyrophosphatase MutT (NUDIX family)